MGRWYLIVCGLRTKCDGDAQGHAWALTQECRLRDGPAHTPSFMFYFAATFLPSPSTLTSFCELVSHAQCRGPAFAHGPEVFYDFLHSSVLLTTDLLLHLSVCCCLSVPPSSLLSAILHCLTNCGCPSESEKLHMLPSLLEIIVPGLSPPM